MKNISKLLCAFATITSMLSCSIKAQDKKVINGNLTVGGVTYSVRNPQNGSLILIYRDDVFEITGDIEKNSSKRDIRALNLN